MAGGKETPRQKMIGMMYLVLTALLALNVSKEILDAFVVVNNGLEQTDKKLLKKQRSSLQVFGKGAFKRPRACERSCGQLEKSKEMGCRYSQVYR